MRVEILYFPDCPHYLTAVNTVRETLAQEGVLAEIAPIEVRDNAAAQQLRFLGSPSIRIDGTDIEVAARDSREFGLSCRTYAAYGGRAGTPPQEWIRAAVREANGTLQ
jgi:hypothetical protein